MKDGLFYSEEALQNRIIFYSDNADIIILVEDENKEFIYENIFQRMFDDKEIISKILPMKGKKGVEKAFYKFGDIYDKKPIVYLVDGDFDLIMGKKMICSPNFIYLEKYNIESYYIDEKAVLKYMSGKMKLVQKLVSERIEYSSWKNMIYDKMKDLFINYVIAQDVFPEEKNVGTSPYCYLYKDGSVNESRISEYICRLKGRVYDYENKYNFYMARYETILLNDASRLICGKYLLASLTNYLRDKAKVTFKEEDFIYFLASCFDIKALDYVRKRILPLI